MKIAARKIWKPLWIVLLVAMFACSSQGASVTLDGVSVTPDASPH